MDSEQEPKPKEVPGRYHPAPEGFSPAAANPVRTETPLRGSMETPGHRRLEAKTKFEIWLFHLGTHMPAIIAFLVVGVLYYLYREPLNIFGLHVGKHFFTLGEGSVATVLLWIYQGTVLKNAMSRPWWVAIFLAFLFFACFQAWEEEYLSRIQREKDVISANGDRDKWKALANLATGIQPPASPARSLSTGKAHLDIFINGSSADHQTVFMSKDGRFSLSIMATNAGTAPTTPPDAYLYFSQRCPSAIPGAPPLQWSSKTSTEKDFPVGYFYGQMAVPSLSSQQPWPYPDFTCLYQPRAIPPFLPEPMTYPPINGKLRIFYGADKPAETNFIIRLME